MDQAVGEPGWPNLDPARADALMDAVLDQLIAGWQDSPLQQDALGLWQGEELLRRVRHAASVLTRFAGNSDFEVAGTEVEFGGSDGLPPLVLALPEGDRIALQGKIDRMDLYRGPDGDFLRILDLKSSGKKLDPARMADGEQLQLMI